MSGDGAKERPVETRGGYPAGPKRVTELAPPPKGPAPGATPIPADSGSQKAKDRS